MAEKERREKRGGRRPTAAHRAEYALARALETAVSALPGRAADALGRGAGRLVGGPLSLRRKVVDDNLRRAFPDADDEWIERTARAAYAHLGRESAAILRLSRMTPEEVVRRTEVDPDDWAVLQGAMAEGRGALLVTGHFGNWEVAAAAVAARGLPIAAIVRRQGNPLVDARLDALRRRLGVETVEMRDAPRRIPRILRKNGIVGIVGDQDARRAGVFVPFFGRLASTYRGPALFALRFDAAVIAAAARRLPGAEPRWRVSGTRVPVVRSDDNEADVRALTAALAARLEEEVRRAPEQYFWFHRRWKTPPPEPAPGAGGTNPSDPEQDPAPNDESDAR